MGSLTDAKISTVVPATPHGDENSSYRLGSMDLLMKLHYIRTVHFFGADAARGLSIHDLKKSMFLLLDPYSHLSGRIRRAESGRPFIKCNDAGIRIAESCCHDSLEEWFARESRGGVDEEELVHDHVLGPDLGFSPLVFLKFTWFKCGGLCVGLSWSHVLGDAFSSFNFITMWSQTLAGHVPKNPPELQPQLLHNNPPITDDDDYPNTLHPISCAVKRATAISDDHWLVATGHTKLVTRSFFVAPKQLRRLAKDTNQVAERSYFEILSAMVWKCIARIRGDFGPKGCVTICTRGANHTKHNDEFPTNGMVLSIVEGTDVTSTGELELPELAKLINEKKKVENHKLEKLVEESEGKEDFIVYGASLTFVNLEEANVYGVTLNGKKPIIANCSLHGVGDRGVVLVLPALAQDKGEGSSGRMITVSLPQEELDQLKYTMEGEWGISSHPF